jgi:hypothetical protein
MLDFSTIVIFAFGKIQIVKNDSTKGSINFKHISSIDSLIENIKSFAPAGIDVNEYNQIIISNNLNATYLGKIIPGQVQVEYSVKFEDLDHALLANVINDLAESGL